MSEDSTATPDIASARTRHLQRAANAVLKKLSRAYTLADEEIRPNPPYFLEWQNAAILGFQRERWQEKREIQMARCALDAGVREPLNQIGLKALNRYLHGFTLRRQLMQLNVHQTEPVAAAYQLYHVRRGLMDIYINHITNLTESEFRDAGLDDDAAHALNGFIIGQAVAMQKHRDSASAYVSPQQPHKPTNAAALRTQLDELRNYWRAVASHEIRPRVLPHYRNSGTGGTSR